MFVARRTGKVKKGVSRDSCVVLRTPRKPRRPAIGVTSTRDSGTSRRFHRSADLVHDLADLLLAHDERGREFDRVATGRVRMRQGEGGSLRYEPENPVNRRLHSEAKAWFGAHPCGSRANSRASTIGEEHFVRLVMLSHNRATWLKLEQRLHMTRDGFPDV